MPEHVNMMDKSMKHQIEIDHIGEENKVVLREFLESHDAEMWRNSTALLHETLKANN